jgi:hypothetical protein
MGTSKRKTNIKIYSEKILTERRQEMLDMITKSDPYLPDSILHDDLDRGLLDYVIKNFKVVSDGKQIPVIEKILTIQRWAEFTNNWEFSDDDGIVQLPFVSIIRKPDVQFGTNPSVQRTIPDRHQFYYSVVQTWNGNQKGADVYKIPQPIPVDITYDVTIICNKFRDVNKFNKIVLQHFASRQDYTMVKGHYIPLILNKIEDNTPMQTLDGRRFYVQTYQFTMLGFLIDSEEFEVTPAISRAILMDEIIVEGRPNKSVNQGVIDVSMATFIGNSTQIIFSVGEPISIIFNVTINGLTQREGVDYFHIANSPRISFATPPASGSVIVITYYKGRNKIIKNNDGAILNYSLEYFTYDGSTLIFSPTNRIVSVVLLEVNGLVEVKTIDYRIISLGRIELLSAPVIGSVIGVGYIY